MHSCALAVACALMTGPAWAAAPPAVESDAGMVVSAQHDASEAGAAVLRQGGNAIDAAVAVGYALAVTHPCCGNIGGGGFMVVHLADGRSTFINFRERAPLAATANMYLDAHGNPIADKSINGYLSVGTPGTVLGLETARQEYGTMSRQALIAPAIHLAEQGFTLTQGDVDVFAEGNARLSQAAQRQRHLPARLRAAACRRSAGAKGSRPDAARHQRGRYRCVLPRCHRRHGGRGVEGQRWNFDR